MTIQQCKYVIKVAECGSFNEAAKFLFVAQSSLSVSVKTLEQELGIRIFERSGNGVCLTEEGTEFLQYARQITEHNDFILERYGGVINRKHLYISTQHYDFVADTFARLVNENRNESYRFSLREMKTYDVIREVEGACCDIGILGIKGRDFGVMDRYLNRRGLSFTPITKALPHVYVRCDHPLIGKRPISLEDLINYPFISYEQGEHGVSFFAEEIANIHSDKQIVISDRASLMNVLLATDCYTVGTGIMPSVLNEGRIASVPFESGDYYIIGYILRVDRRISPLAQRFINLLIGNFAYQAGAQHV